MQVRLTCEWPAGTDCPGQLGLRTRFKVARTAPPRQAAADPHRHPLARPAHLPPERRQVATPSVPLSAGGRALLRERGKLRTQLIAAIPGGRGGS